MADLVRRKEVSPLELVQDAIERIERHNGVLNAVVYKNYEAAIEEARGFDRLDAPFAGVPFLLKDFFARAAGMPLTEGSLALRGYVPPADSELVRRYRRAGLIILGKTNTPEFGAVPVAEGQAYGAARNPWSLDLTTGGSSGGSAAAVSTGMVPMAHGNDGGGSLRIPASCCGVFGLKPSRGRNPLAGGCSELHARILCEHAITRSVRDSARLLEFTAGAEHGQAYIAQGDVSFSESTTASRRLRIALTPDPIMPVEVHPDCRAALADAAALCESLGHEVLEAQIEVDGEELMTAWFDLWAEAVGYLVAETEERTSRALKEDEFESLTWQYYLRSRERTAFEHLRSLEILQRGAAAIERFMEKADVWLTPTLAQPPLPLGSFLPVPASVPRYLTFSPFTRLANLSGLPAMSVPLFWNEDGIPIGTHFAAGLGREGTLFGLAAELEAARPWAHRPPTVLEPGVH